MGVLGFDTANSFLFDSATSCLTVMLRALDLPTGSGVAVPMYACVSVFEAVAAAGLQCVFIDLDSRTWTYDCDSLERHKDEFRAVILIHLFGFAADVAELQRAIGPKPVIEDCSHAFGSADSHGGRIGHAGIASVFSFNINKPLSAGGGGLLVVNDVAYLARVEQIYASTAQAKEERFELLRLMVRVWCFRPAIYSLLAVVGLIKLRRPGALYRPVEVRRISESYLSLICSRLRTIDFRWERQRRQAQNMAHTGIETPVRDYGHPFWNAYLFPVLAPDVNCRGQLLSFFNTMGIDAFELWPECSDTAARFGYNHGRCSNTEQLVRRLLFVPCYAEMRSDRHNHILNALSRAKSLGRLHDEQR